MSDGMGLPKPLAQESEVPMVLHLRLKPLVASLAVSSLIGIFSMADIASLHLASAEPSTSELTPILLMEETAKPATTNEDALEPPVPTLDLEDAIAPTSSRGITEFVPTRTVKEMLSQEKFTETELNGQHAQKAETPGNVSSANMAPLPATTGNASTETVSLRNTTTGAASPQAKNCQIAEQLNLTHNQRYRLKRWKSSFVRDNQAAFDSIRIKRNLLKRLGKHPASGRDQQQSAELRKQIHQEWKALQTKREAQIAHVLSETQYEKWQALRQECQPQSAAPAPGMIFNRNPDESQLHRTLRQHY
jgi:hypothetical protein